MITMTGSQLLNIQAINKSCLILKFIRKLLQNNFLQRKNFLLNKLSNQINIH